MNIPLNQFTLELAEENTDPEANSKFKFEA